jgi:hypothetical protein
LVRILVTEYKGIQICVESTTGTFSAAVNEKELTAQTLEDLQGKLNAQVKTDLAFKPVDAIQTRYDRRVTITSLDRNESHYPQIWAKYVDGVSYRLRGKESLGTDDFVRATPENLVILNEVKALLKEREELDAKISAKRYTYKGYLTKADLDGSIFQKENQEIKEKD